MMIHYRPSLRLWMNGCSDWYVSVILHFDNILGLTDVLFLGILWWHYEDKEADKNHSLR